MLWEGGGVNDLLEYLPHVSSGGLEGSMSELQWLMIGGGAHRSQVRASRRYIYKGSKVRKRGEKSETQVQIAKLGEALNEFVRKQKEH